jgi:alkanesulfonate monooxygenase SsuD/methylene tetrahydromethanopterin reductase-like flavin-dependent oxidoreductase (luciferase family)
MQRTLRDGGTMADDTVTATTAAGSGRSAPVRFGWRMPMWDPDGAPATAWLPDVRANLEALRGKYDSVWLSDHFIPGTRWMPYQPDTLECWTGTAFWAGAFPDFQYGQIVMGNSFRHPPLLAKSAATLQTLSGGKLILGIGAGWYEDEYQMYGYPFPSGRVRLEQLDEAVQIMRRMWTTSPASFDGRHYTIDSAICNPLPDPPIPLLIGSSGEKVALRIVARHADWWDYSGAAPGEFARKAAVLAEHCEAVGRDPSSILYTWQCQTVSIADSAAEALRLAEQTTLYRNSSKDGVLIGTPEQIVERMAEYIAVGVRHVILRFADFPRPDVALRFIAELAPRLRAAVPVRP